RADAFAVEEDRRAAHAGDDAGAAHFRRVDFGQDAVLSRPDVVEDADDLHVELLKSRPLEDGQAVALHPLVDLRERHRLGRHDGRDADTESCEKSDSNGSLHVETNPPRKSAISTSVPGYS